MGGLCGLAYSVHRNMAEANEWRDAAGAKDPETIETWRKCSDQLTVLKILKAVACISSYPLLKT
jgi:hypothetical protein